MKALLPVIFVMMLFLPSVLAAPQVDSHLGTVSDGETITIYGSDFGVKFPVEPAFWETFESGTNGVGISTPTIGSYGRITDYVEYTNDDSYSGLLSAYEYYGNDQTESITGVATDWIPDETQNAFASMKVKFVSDSGSLALPSSKMLRLNTVYPNGDFTHGDPNFVAGLTGQRTTGSLEIITNIGSGWCPNCAVEPGQIVIGSVLPSEFGDQNDEWFSISIWNHLGDEGVANGFAGREFNGNVVQVNNIVTKLLGFVDYDGFRAAGFNNHLGLYGTTLLEYWMDDLYADTTLARVVIAENSDWNSQGNNEMQVPVNTWQDDQLQIELNQGRFVEGITYYLFVVDEFGDPSNPYPIMFGEEITDPYITTLSSDELTDGESINITGVNFGTKSPVAPLRWDDFEDGIIGDDLKTWEEGGWDAIEDDGGIINVFYPMYTYDNPRVPGEKVIQQTYDMFDETRGMGTQEISIRQRFDFTELYATWWAYRDDFEGIASCSDNQKLLGNAGYRLGETLPAQDRVEQHYGIIGEGGSHYFDFTGRQPGESPGDDIIGGGGSSWYNHWHRVGRYIKLTGDQGYSTVHKDEQLVSEINDKAFSSEPYVYNYFLTGQYFRLSNDGETGVDNPPTCNASLKQYIGEMYVDTTQARIEICDSSDWNSRTHCEIQIPESGWDDTTGRNIEFTVNRGSFDGTEQLWLYVIDENGIASNGREVNFAAQTTDPYISTITSNELNDGDSIRITGGNFGPKNQPAPLLWDTVVNQPAYNGLQNGDVAPVYRDKFGNVVCVDCPWRGNSDPDNTDPPHLLFSGTEERVSNKGYYYVDTKGFLRGFDYGLSEPEQFYLSWYLRSTIPANEWGLASAKVDRMFAEEQSSVVDHNDAYTVLWSNAMSIVTGPTTTRNEWISMGLQADEWYRLEHMMDSRGLCGSMECEGGIVKAWRNGELFHDHTFGGFTPANQLGVFGFDPSVTEPYLDDRVFWGEVYLDDTQARIEICDSNVWDDSVERHCEVQIPHSEWEEGAIQFTVNQGSFTDTEQLWLFVIDEDGVASNGRAVSFGTTNPPECGNTICETGEELTCPQDCIINSDCTLDNALWNRNAAQQTVTEPENVLLVASGTGCEGETVDFEIFEVDSDSSPDTPTLANPPASVTFTGSTATTTWNTEYYEDLDGPNPVPEYIFVATINSDRSINTAVNEAYRLEVEDDPDYEPQPKTNIYDIYVDGTVNILDLLELANSYGTTSTINDYSGDGKINIIDLLELINNFS